MLQRIVADAGAENPSPASVCHIASRKYKTHPYHRANDTATVLEAGNSTLIVTYLDELQPDSIGNIHKRNTGRLPVVEQADPGRVVGYLGRSCNLATRLRIITMKRFANEADSVNITLLLKPAVAVTFGLVMLALHRDRLALVHRPATSFFSVNVSRTMRCTS